MPTYRTVITFAQEADGSITKNVSVDPDEMPGDIFIEMSHLMADIADRTRTKAAVLEAFAEMQAAQQRASTGLLIPTPQIEREKLRVIK